jgi:Phage integrase family
VRRVEASGRQPLRQDELLRPWIEGRSPSVCVFDVLADLIKRFNADCKRAGIPKINERGKSVDLHLLRMTFNTWLAKAGVAPRVAQELIRHEDIDLTMNVYTDPALFDLSVAVKALPALHQMLHRTGGSGVQRMSTWKGIAGVIRMRRKYLGRMKKSRISRGFLHSWGSRIRT